MTDVLPKHQYAPFHELVNRFGATYVPSKYRWLFQRLITIWLRIFNIESVEKVISEDFADGRDGFWHADWIWDELFYPEISATFIGEAEEADPVLRSAELIHGAIDFYLKVKSQTLSADLFSGRPQDMERYQYLFSRLTIARLDGRALKHRITDMPSNDYVVVGINGHLLKVVAIKDEKPIAVSELYHALKKSLNTLAELEFSNHYKLPIGKLTALQNRMSVKMWNQVEAANQESIKVLNQALFTLTIDADLHPKDLDETLSGLNSRVSTARDCRRSLQIVVAKNGSFGAVVNPHAGIGGTLSARFVSELSMQCKDTNRQQGVGKDPSIVEYLRFKDPNLDQISLEQLDQAIQGRLYGCDERTVFQFEGIGSKTFKNHGLHVDAAFHAALALAWFRSRGYAPTIGNFINLRSVKFGDIWRYDATTDAMHAFLCHPTREMFKRAEQAHINLIKKHKSAADEFYLGAMGIKRLVCEGVVRFSGFVSLVSIFSIFVKDFKRRFINPDLWVSCIPSIPGVKAAGRAGSTMSYLSKTSTGGHYMIFDDHIIVCLMNPKKGKWRGTESAFAEELGRCLRLVGNL